MSHYEFNIYNEEDFIEVEYDNNRDKDHLNQTQLFKKMDIINHFDNKNNIINNHKLENDDIYVNYSPAFNNLFVINTKFSITQKPFDEQSENIFKIIDNVSSDTYYYINTSINNNVIDLSHILILYGTYNNYKNVTNMIDHLYNNKMILIPKDKKLIFGEPHPNKLKNCIFIDHITGKSYHINENDEFIYNLDPQYTPIEYKYLIKNKLNKYGKKKFNHIIFYLYDDSDASLHNLYFFINKPENKNNLYVFIISGYKCPIESSINYENLIIIKSPKLSHHSIMFNYAKNYVAKLNVKSNYYTFITSHIYIKEAYFNMTNYDVINSNLLKNKLNGIYYNLKSPLIVDEDGLKYI